MNRNLTAKQNLLVSLAHAVSKRRAIDPGYRTWLATPGNHFLIGKKHANACGVIFAVLANTFIRSYVAATE